MREYFSFVPSAAFLLGGGGVVGCVAFSAVRGGGCILQLGAICLQGKAQVSCLGQHCLNRFLQITSGWKRKGQREGWGLGVVMWVPL